MNYKFWEFIDDLLNNFSVHLYNIFKSTWLLNKTMALTNQSSKDIQLFKEMKDIFQITDFEIKIHENGAYKKKWNPIPASLFIPESDPEREAYRLHFIKMTNINVTIVKWTTEQLILLNAYKSDSKKMKRFYTLQSYYHKNHFFMTIGLREISTEI